MRELLLGCGARVGKLVSINGSHAFEDVTRLDHNPAVKPDVLWDLNDPSLPFDDDAFDEIHAYDVLEHVGQQGDWRFFFRQFDSFWRVLKPGGYFMAVCPKADGIWAWGDPGHTRVITPQSLSFLHRPLYGSPPMTDYRSAFVSDWEIIYMRDFDAERHAFVLQAVKPAR